MTEFPPFLPTARELDEPPVYEKVPQEPGPGIPPMPRPAPPGPEGEKAPRPSPRLPRGRGRRLGAGPGPVARSAGVVAVYKIDRTSSSATFVAEGGEETVVSADTIESVAMLLSEVGALSGGRRTQLARMFAESVGLIVIPEEQEAGEPPPMTPREALESIIEEVRGSDDRAKAAGRWLTITTNAILEAGKPDDE